MQMNGEKEIKKAIPFIITSKSIKYLAIHFALEQMRWKLYLVKVVRQSWKTIEAQKCKEIFHVSGLGEKNRAKTTILISDI